MVKMLTHRMMDNLSCMLLAKDELQAHLQAQAAAHEGMEVSAQQEKMEDSELAKENAQLRRQLLEAAADNDAISRSLQERVASLTDVIDAKFKAESEAKVLQVQMKSMQKDMDAHKYELHLLRKQLQIRNDERDQNKKASDASHNKHLDNVKKIARLESECQRLRALIRQRLPGPAVIAQMRAECDMHITMGKKRSHPPSKSLPNSSYLHHQREREALMERLLSVEDEAKFLKEALAKRTAELQEARQLCARTAMKLSSAQDLVETMSMASVPSTPQPQRNMHSFNIKDAPMQDQDKSTSYIEQEGHVYVSSIMHRENMMSIDTHEEESSCTNGDVDELSCAESWASALFAELSHLSNFHENAAVGTSENVRISNPKDREGSAIGFKPDASIQELDLYSALQTVSQKLSHVGENVLLSNLTYNDDQVNHADMKGNDANISTPNFCADGTGNIVLEMDQTCNILDEISHIKHLLLELGRFMELQDKLYNGSVNVINDDHESISDDISANQEGKISAINKRERILSRFSAEGTKFSEGAKISTTTNAKLEEGGDKVIKCCAEDTKFSEDAKISANTSADMQEVGDKMINCSAECIKFSGETASMEEFDEKSAKLSAIAITSRVTMEGIDDRMIRSLAGGSNLSGNAKCSMDAGTKFSENAKFFSANMEPIATSVLQLHLAGATSDVASVEPAYVDVHVDLHPLLLAAQADLELSRGKIATLEAELSRVLQEKADVAQQLSDTCSLKKTLEAELACSVANVEELQLQVFSLQSQLADQRTSTPLSGGQPVIQLDEFFNVKEEQDLAVARAQLADCQRNIHVMRTQMASEILNSPSQDVITDDLTFFDSSSHDSSSPTMSKAANLSPKINNLNPTEHNNISPPLQPEDKSSSHSMSSNTNVLQESRKSHHMVEEEQSFEKCRVDHVDEDLKSSDLLMRSTSVVCEDSPTLKPLIAKPPKLSTTSRIVEFFNKAKSTRRSIVL